MKNDVLSSFYKNLALIALPIILQNLLQTFINMLDTIMVGQLGSVEIEAVRLGNQIFFMLNMVVFGISSGGSIFITQYWGRHDFDGIKKTTGVILFFALASSIIFTSLCLLLPEKIISLYSNDSEVINLGAKYLRMVSLCYPFFALSFCFQMAFRSTEHVYLPTACTAISMTINLICNYLFIFGFDLTSSGIPLVFPPLGVIGAAIGTIIARIIESLIAVPYSYAKKFEPCGNLKELLGFDGGFLLRLVKIALPVLLSETLWGLGITFQNGIYARTGTQAIAAFNITNTVSQLTWIFFIGVGNASAILIGKRIGAGENEAAKAYAHRFAWFMPLMGLILGTFLIPLSYLLPKLFNVEGEVISIARMMLYLMAFLYPFRSFNMLMIVGVCRAGGDTVFSMIIDNGAMWLISIPLAMAGAFIFHFPIWGIFLCLESEQFLKMILGAFRMKSGKWLRNVTE